MYQLWRVSAGRSLTEVERRTGIPRQTVARWRDDEKWIERANQEAAEAVHALPEAVGALVVTETVRSIETVIAIRDDPNANAKDRLSAAYWLAGIGGIGPVSRIEQAVKHEIKEEVTPPDFDAMNVVDLRELEATIKRKKR